MAQPPITFLEKQWANGWRSNVLYQAAIQSPDRKATPYLDYDIHKSVTWYGRRIMMNIGRLLYANNSSPIRGMINEMAELASSSFTPQFFGEDEAWAAKAEEWMEHHDLICDRAGAPYNMRLYRRNVLIGVIRDGDVGTILTEVNGYPQLQVIPAHRIGSRQDQVLIEDKNSPYDGCRITDGVITDDYTMPLAYRIFGENPWDVQDFVDVPADNMFLSFIPEWVGQVRGFSSIASSAFYAQDIMESRQYSLLGQKANAAISYIEENEQSGAMPGAAFVIPPSRAAQVSQNASSHPERPSVTGLNYELLDGGIIRYFKARSGSKITSPSNDRPTENQQTFEDRIVRGIFHGVNWSTDFSLDPTKAGGAQMRIIIDKVNRTIQTFQDLLLLPAMQRFNGYRLSKSIKLGLLPDSPDWWKFYFVGPEELTADRKYSSDVSCQEVEAGLSCREHELNKRRMPFERTTRKAIRERAFMQVECEKIGKEMNTTVDPDKIWRFKTNSPVSTDQNSPEEEPEKKSKPESSL